MNDEKHLASTEAVQSKSNISPLEIMLTGLHNLQGRKVVQGDIDEHW